MEQATISQVQAADAGEQSANWLRAVRALAKRVGCEEALGGSLARLEALGRATVDIALIGGPNSGKSSLINDLLGRGVLPASPIPSLASFIIEGISAGANETFTVANAVRPLAQLPGALSSAQGSPIQATLAVDNEWLRSSPLRVVEKPALDADDKSLPQVIDALLRDTDVVVLVMDALMPMKRSEADLLRECGRRRLPVLIVITKAAKLSEDERRSVRPYVEKQARQYVPGIAVVDTGARGLREAIGSLLEHTDISAVRFEQFKHAVRAALEAIRGAAIVAAEAESKSHAEREAEINLRKGQIEAQNLIWMQIEEQLDKRREQIENEIRSHLMANQVKVLDFLYYDLDKCNDVKTWWERDMPFRLRHELHGQLAGLTASIDRQLAADRRWLQEELHRQFRYPLAIGPEPAVDISANEVDRRSLPLADGQKLRIVARVGQGAVVIAAGVLFASAGLTGAVVGTGVVAGLGAELWSNRKTATNRRLVRGELSALVGSSCGHYASDISSKLKGWYGQIIGAVKERQREWQQAQIEALQPAKEQFGAGEFDWTDILQQIDALVREISLQMTAPA